MRFPWFKSARHKSDLIAAEDSLRRVRSQRAEVDALVASLIRERHMNNFTANVVVTFRGGRP